MPDSLAGLVASAAVSITDIPFNGPFSEVRVIKRMEFIYQLKLENFTGR